MLYFGYQCYGDPFEVIQDREEEQGISVKYKEEYGDAATSEVGPSGAATSRVEQGRE